MKHALTILAAACLGAALLASPATASKAQDDSPTEQRNRALVSEAFSRWEQGQGDVFDLLAEDVVWSIAGNDPSVARTYRGKASFLEQTVTPFGDRMSAPLRPTVRGLWADGDTVLVQWDGAATARDGQPYRNSYLWIFTLEGDKASAVTAYLDNAAFKAVFERMPTVEGSE